MKSAKTSAAVAVVKMSAVLLSVLTIGASRSLAEDALEDAFLELPSLAVGAEESAADGNEQRGTTNACTCYCEEDTKSRPRRKLIEIPGIEDGKSCTAKEATSCAVRGPDGDPLYQGTFTSCRWGFYGN